MKSRFGFWAAVTASTFGLFVAAAGCSAEVADESLSAEEPLATGVEDESVTRNESAVDEPADVVNEGEVDESADAIISPLIRPRGTCYYGTHCTGNKIALNVTARMCGESRLGGGSWRRTYPTIGVCIKLYNPWPNTITR